MAFEEQQHTDGWRIFSDFSDKIRDLVLDAQLDVNPQLDEDQYLRQFGLLDSKKKQFHFVWQDRVCRDTLRDLLSSYLLKQNIVNHLKSSQKSKRHRNKGNNLFKENKFLEALQEYSKAVVLAPYPTANNSEPDDVDCLALALNNRSATLFSLKRYTRCLSDIELSLKYGYPETSQYKLYIRKVKCLHLLSMWSNDFEDIKRNLLNRMVNSRPDSVVRKEIEKMFNLLRDPVPDYNNDADYDTISRKSYKIAHYSKLIERASDYIEMAHTNEKGRYVVANKPTQFGQPLIVEEPFATYLAPCYITRYCYNCFKKLYGLGIGCLKCDQVLYCTEECRDKNWEHVHYLECLELFPLQSHIGIAHLALHMISVPKLDTITTSPPIDLDDLSQWTEKSFAPDYQSVCSLLDHHRDHEVNDVYVYTLTAALLVEALIHCTIGKPLLIEEDKQVILGEIIMTHLMQLSTNAIAILDQLFNRMSTDVCDIKERPVGTAIYATVSLLNHSCKPNVLTMFQNSKMIVRASGRIQPGDEVSYCYGPSIRSMSKKDRRIRLKNQYYFDCMCSACANDVEDETRALECSSCKGPVIYNLDYTSQCMKCKKEDLDVQSKLNKIEELKYNLLSMISVTDVKQDAKELIDIKQRLFELVYWKNRVMVEARKGLYSYFKATKQYNLALECINEHLEYLIGLYTPISYEVVKESLEIIAFRTFLLGNISFRSREEASRLLAFIDETRLRLKGFCSCTSIKEAEQLYSNETQFLREKHNEVKRIFERL